MKEKLLMLALDILYKIVADLLDNGKLDGSAKKTESEKSPS